MVKDPLTKLMSYALDKYYVIHYDFGREIKTITGLLIHYPSPVVVMNEKGVYHLESKNIKDMHPISMPPAIAKHPCADLFNEYTTSD